MFYKVGNIHHSFQQAPVIKRSKRNDYRNYHYYCQNRNTHYLKLSNENRQFIRAITRLSLLIFAVFISGCGSDNKTEVELEQELIEQHIPETEKISRFLNEGYTETMRLNNDEVEFLKSIYAERNFNPMWMKNGRLDSLGTRLQNLLNKSIQLSIPQNRIRSLLVQNYLQQEFSLTLQLAYVIHDLDSGFIHFENHAYKAYRLPETSRFNVFSDLKIEEDLRVQLFRRGCQDSLYIELAQELRRRCDRFPMDSNTYEIKGIRIDTLETMIFARQALISKGYLHESADSSDFLDALLVYQSEHGLKPDGKVGKYTAQSLNESQTDKLLRIALTMDKIRQRKKYPENFIRINIPAYRLDYYHDDTLRSSHRIVVGTPENQTPELQSKLQKIIVYPYWKVPYSIASKEILPAVKRSPSYLIKNNYKLFRKDVEVNPYSVRWKSIRENSFPYTVIQQPGPTNSLGIIKFEFYNNYSVYFHDTPSKALFNTDIRAYSHGCMRTQNPVDLAKKILEYDSIPRKRNSILPDSLDSLLTLEENYEIKLVSRIPIFIEYRTVDRCAQGICVFPDVYGRDQKFLRLMKKEEE